MAKEDLKSYKIYKLMQIILILSTVAYLGTIIYLLYLLNHPIYHPVYRMLMIMIFGIFTMVCIADTIYNLIRSNSFKKLYNDLGNETNNRKVIKFRLDKTNTYKISDIVLGTIELLLIPFLVILPVLVFPVLLKALGIYHTHILKKELEEMQYFDIHDKSIKEGE